MTMSFNDHNKTISDILPITEILPKTVDNIQRASANADGVSGVPSGFHKLDCIISGFHGGELITIAGRPAMGKTSFALSIVKNVAVDHKIPVLFLSLEMSATTIANRLISNVSDISMDKIQSGQLAPFEWALLEYRIKLLKDAPLFIDDTPNLNVEGIESKAKKWVEGNGIRLVIIDYFQLISTPYRSNRTRHDELTEIMHTLKIMARKLDIPIILLSQLNRGVEDRGFNNDGKRPQLRDLRECGVIEEDSDIVLFIHRPEYYHIYQDENGRDLRGLAQIIIAKHRMGPTGDVQLRFRGKFAKFVNPEDCFPVVIPL
ncbi:MAG: replicative DNA helicase [Alloprevotella sp.]|nr:replicative DNA helicase [Alloprevotella sp.]